MSYFKILILNGPNLNLLGTREKKIYGTKSLNTLINELYTKFNQSNVKITHLQSNAEHILIEKIQKSNKNIDYIIINPAAFAHTSIALRDALLSINVPFIEVHISNIYSREKFRSHSWLSDIAQGIICGFGTDGYYWAIKTALKRLKKKHNY
ncbi:type II 3-dehydroquinate dehydratase [Buchnera aphidicola]|uniref:3-dehydroquinate dehydratase n=1 Tax=Buchnera aphidicola (Stegophylla sp.) TaxID=2315800 RepID=A0A4D6Y9M3_9GAMM|nr:type II 3-dehydroquinate dehydratase [Buchnera aphidicola (Stegophylla sp.)]QCI26417.1 type II 3-dehydroquinate dehydratase [Buchnera aphidicola (Stegophylla sp.)]